jgi:hypothetical protein
MLNSIIIKMRFLTIIALLFITNSVLGQTWSGEVAQLFYDKCTKCHHPGGTGGNSLMTYDDVNPMASIVTTMITNDQMPPWPPDNNYQQYLHTRSLTATEKTTILNWLNNGLPIGNSASIPPPPVYTNSTYLGNGDLTIQIPTYTSKAQGIDDYACFAIPTNLTQNRTIKAIEVVPGNPAIVHHALIYVDPAGNEVTDTIGGNCASPSLSTTKLLMGYTPGATPLVLPNASPLKLGMDIGPGSNIYFQMHYPNGSFGLQDSTKVILHFYPVGTSGIRQITASPIISNYNFSLPANQISTLNGQYPNGTSGLPVDVSIFSVFPHMHLLGQSIKSYATNNVQDTIKFINIPQWDFHWQDFYYFTHLQKVPAGYTIRGRGVYDNTINNPENPNSPPATVNFGLNTTDEMFLIYFHYLTYQAGDENYDLEQLTSLSLNEFINDKDDFLTCYPNPFINEITITSNEMLTSTDLVYVYNSAGELIKQIKSDTNKMIWDGKNENGITVPNGVYFLSTNIKGHFYSQKLIKLN